MHTSIQSNGKWEGMLVIHLLKKVLGTRATFIDEEDGGIWLVGRLKVRNFIWPMKSVQEN